MTIGIMGCDSGTGVTHLAIALCSYCCSKQRKRAAFLELHTRNEISQLIPESELFSAMNAPSRIFCSPEVHCSTSPLGTSHALESGQGSLHFKFHGVDYYPHVSDNEIPALLNRGYDYLILDMGSLKEADLSEFLRCDRKLVLGSLAPWKIWTYEEFFRQFDKSVNLGEGFYYLAQTGTTKKIPQFSKTHHISMSGVPFIKNPFHIEKELFLFLGTLLAAP